MISFSSQPLVNNYHHLTLDASDLTDVAFPGHYIIIDNKFACYILGQQNGFEIIVNSQQMEYLKTKQQVTISPLQGQPITPPDKNQFCLLMAEDEGLSAVIFYFKKYRTKWNGLVLIGSTMAFPFAPCPSKLIIAHFPAHVIAAIPLLEDWGIPNRLASTQEMPGVFEGKVEDLIMYCKSPTQTIVIPKLRLIF